MKTPPIVSALFNAARESVEEFKLKISDVKAAGFNDERTEQKIHFKISGELYEGFLNGRNRDLCIGFGEAEDRAIACRVFLDRQAKKI
jgi:hypothetical protein